VRLPQAVFLASGGREPDVLEAAAPGLLFARNRQIRIIDLPSLRRVLDGVGR